MAVRVFNNTEEAKDALDRVIDSVTPKRHMQHLEYAESIANDLDALMAWLDLKGQESHRQGQRVVNMRKAIAALVTYCIRRGVPLMEVKRIVADALDKDDEINLRSILPGG